MHRRISYTAWNVLTVVGLVVAVGILVWLLAWAKVLADRTTEQRNQIGGLVAQYGALYKEAQAGGVDPSAPAPAEVEEEAATMVGPAGERGLRGPMGPQGIQGIPGSPGIPGVPGEPIVGPQGESGLDGSDGFPCSSDIPECVGPAGADGADGSPGPAGASGEPPLSWIFTVNGRDFACVRTESFDPAAPTYTCTNTVADQ